MADKFKKIDKEYLITDSSLNSYSYRLLTSGYDLSAYKKNPIGYYMHGTDEFPREMGVLVKWDDLRADGDKVFGKPCINLTHPRGQRTVDEVESGFLNAASVGHLVALEISENPEDYLPGQKGVTVSKWFNRETSLVDVPGNFNALTDLVDAKGNLLNLADFNINKITMKQIFLNPAQLAHMNLKADAEQSAVDTAFANLVAKAGRVDGLETELAAEKLKLTGFQNDLKAANEQAVKDLFAEAATANKCTKAFADLMTGTLKDNLTEAKKVVAELKPYTPITTALSGEAADDYKGKTWDELDKSGKLENLKATNRAHYNKLFKDQFGKEPNA